MSNQQRRLAGPFLLCGWLLFIWLIAADRAATADEVLGGARTWYVADVAEHGFLTIGPKGVVAYSVQDGHLTTTAQASVRQRRAIGPTDVRCSSPACTGIVFSAESGLEIDSSAPTFVTGDGSLRKPLGSRRSRVGVVQADNADRLVALLADVGAPPRLVSVQDGNIRTLAAAGGLGLDAVSSPRGSRLAVTTGQGDGDVGVPGKPKTHWLSRADGDWTVTSEDAANPACIADDGSAVAVDRDAPELRRPDGGVHALPAATASDPRVFRPCVVGPAGALLVVYESEEQILVRTGGRNPASRFALVWTGSTGEAEARVRLDARWVSPSPDQAHVAAVNRDDEVVVFDRHGTKKTVAKNAAAAEFLGNGQLVVVDQRGRARLVPEEQWR